MCKRKSSVSILNNICCSIDDYNGFRSIFGPTNALHAFDFVEM